MNRRKTGFENLHVYLLAEQIGDLVWDIVHKWERFAKDTVGKQLKYKEYLIEMLAQSRC